LFSLHAQLIVCFLMQEMNEDKGEDDVDKSPCLGEPFLTLDEILSSNNDDCDSKMSCPFLGEYFLPIEVQDDEPSHDDKEDELSCEMEEVELVPLPDITTEEISLLEVQPVHATFETYEDAFFASFPDDAFPIADSCDQSDSCCCQNCLTFLNSFHLDNLIPGNFFY
jgi:hypothetical protein